MPERCEQNRNLRMSTNRNLCWYKLILHYKVSQKFLLIVLIRILPLEYSYKNVPICYPKNVLPVFDVDLEKIEEHDLVKWFYTVKKLFKSEVKE